MTRQSVAKLETSYDDIVAENINPDDASRRMTREELRASIHTSRAALKDALDNLPESAFVSQPGDADGNEVWSAGEVVTHCNGAFLAIANQVVELTDMDGFEMSDDLQQWAEQRVLTRDEALHAIGLLPIDQLMDAIPSDTDLENSDHSDLFGKMPVRGWLYFLAVHEANHTGQLRELMDAWSGRATC